MAKTVYTVKLADDTTMTLKKDNFTGLLDEESVRMLAEKLEWPMIQKATLSTKCYLKDRAEIMIKPQLPESWELPKFFGDNDNIYIDVMILATAEETDETL